MSKKPHEMTFGILQVIAMLEMQHRNSVDVCSAIHENPFAAMANLGSSVYKFKTPMTIINEYVSQQTPVEDEQA